MFSHSVNHLHQGLTVLLGECLAGEKGKAKEFAWIDQVAIVASPARSEAEEVEENKSETECTLMQHAYTDKMRKSLHKVRQAILQMGIVGSGKSMDQDTIVSSWNVSYIPRSPLNRGTVRVALYIAGKR